jgi:SAM-dependent methyltransferase
MDPARYWDAHAESFDDQPDHGLRDPAVAAAWSRLLEPLLPPAPADVADLGSGTGSLAVLLAAAGHRVQGLDVSPRMVSVARAKAAAADVDITFRIGDAARPPWRRGTFDAVLVRHVLWAMPDADAALRAWIDLLAPGGRLLLVEGHWHTGAGLTAAATTALVLRHRRHADVTVLADPALWGGPIADERYLLHSLR